MAKTFGLVFKVWDAVTAHDWVAVGKVQDLTPPTREAAEPLNKSNHDSPSGVEELEPSDQFKWTDCSARMLNTPADAGQVLLAAAQASGALTYFCVEKASDPTLPVYFSGIVTIFADSAQSLSGLDEKNLVIKPSGDWPTRIISAAPALLNGGFEALGAGGGDVFADWVEHPAGTGAISVETTNIRSGARACKMTVDGSGNAASVSQSVTSGHRYRVILWARNDGTGAVTVDCNGTVITSVLTTEYKRVAIDFTAAVGSLYIYPSVNNASVYVDDVMVLDLTPP